MNIARSLIAGVLLVGVPVLLIFSLDGEKQHDVIRVQRMVDSELLELKSAFEVPFHAVEIRASDQSMFVYNASDQCIVELNQRGDVQRRYGKKGRAQGEFQLITGWDVDSAGVHIVDGRNLVITEMNSLGVLTLHQPLKAMFFRASHMGNRKYVFRMMSPASQKRQLFQVLDINADSSYELAVTMPSVDNDMSLDGVFLRGGNGMLFYMCHWAGYVLAFDREGKQLYVAQTIDKTVPPEIVDPGMRIDPKASLVNISASASEKHFYILSRAISVGDTLKEYVDMYDVSNGAYHRSFTIPQYNRANASAIAVTEKGVYAIQGQWIAYYRFRRPH